MKRKWLWLAPLAMGVSISAVAQAPVPYQHRYYDDGYLVFVGNGNLPRAREVVELYDRGLEYCRTPEELKDICSMRILTVAQIDAAHALRMETLNMQ